MARELLHSYNQVTPEVLERNNITLSQLLKVSPYCKDVVKRFAIRNIDVVVEAIEKLHIQVGELFSYMERRTPIVMPEEQYKRTWTDRWHRTQSKIYSPVYIGENEFSPLRWAEITRYLTKSYYPTLFKAFEETERIPIGKNDTLYTILKRINKDERNITASEIAKIIRDGYYDKPTDKLAFYSSGEWFYIKTACKDKYNDTAKLNVGFDVLLEARRGKDVWNKVCNQNDSIYIPKEVLDTPEAHALHTLLDEMACKARNKKH